MSLRDARSRQGARTSPLAAMLRQDSAQIDFGLRRFRLHPERVRADLEAAGRSFLHGYNATVAGDGRSGVTGGAAAGIAAAIDGLPPTLRGFGYEGAGMGCAILDLLTVSRGRRLRALLSGSGWSYRHLIHVGVGWAYARMRLRPWWGISPGDPLLRWLAWDGYGFHRGFFDADSAVGRQRLPRGLVAEERAIHDQGLGRSLWFHECAEPDGLAARIEEFPLPRRGDLWSGTGLAAAYAGGASTGALKRLVERAGEFRAPLAQGCAFACKARLASGITPDHTRTAAEILAGVPVEDAAAWTDTAAARVTVAGNPTRHVSPEPYQRWRAETRRLFLNHEGIRTSWV